MSLEQAASKIERAKHHVRDLDRAWGQYASDPSHGVAVIQNTEGTRRALRIVMNPPAPPDIALVLGDAIHNLRAALDLAIWEIVSPLGPRSPKKVQFPFVQSGDRFEDALAAREIKRADKKIVDAFRALEPYPKGKGEKLWKLDALDISDKHKLLIPAIAVLSVDELRLHEIDPSAQWVIKGMTFIPDENGRLPLEWPIDAKSAVPSKLDSIIKATFQMAFPRGQQFENTLCIPCLRDLIVEVERTLDCLRKAMI